MTPIEICRDTVEVRKKTLAGEYATPGENSLADRIVELAELISSLAAAVNTRKCDDLVTSDVLARDPLPPHPMTEEEIDVARKASFAVFWNDPRVAEKRDKIDQNTAIAIHSHGFCEGGAAASERGAQVLEIVLVAAERALRHFDKIRPADVEPSSLVEELRKAIKIGRQG